MNKFLSIFKISFEQEFAYKANFIMWRLRNVFQIVITFFLWSTIFSNPQSTFFGYSQSKILTYVFMLMIVRSLVLSAKAADVSSDISEGNLSNHLLKPLSYFKYWFTRDIASKVLNLFFAFFEFVILFAVFRPEFFIQTNFVFLVLFALSILIAVFIYFNILFLISSIPFWAPELGWASQFLVAVVIIEFLSGALFPIDVLPQGLSDILMFTPFPYMIFFPIQIYLGKIGGLVLFMYFTISTVWAFALFVFMKHVWNKGLRVYQATGR